MLQEQDGSMCIKYHCEASDIDAAEDYLLCVYYIINYVRCVKPLRVALTSLYLSKNQT